MNIEIFKFPTITEELYPIVSCIFKDACLEKERQGIHFSFASFTIEDVKKILYDGGGAQNVFINCDGW